MSAIEMNIYHKGTAILAQSPVIVWCETLQDVELKRFGQQEICDTIAPGKYEVALIVLN